MSIQSGEVVYHSALAPLLVDIDSVQPHIDNYNNGDVDEIIESIHASGMYRAIYVSSKGEIVAGNHTWMACKQMHAQQIPVIRLDGDDVDQLRIMIADNRIAALARPDDAQLLKLLDRINDAEGNTKGTGYNENDVEVLRALAEIPVAFDNEVASWPLLTFRVPPHAKAAFESMTASAGDDRSRFELLLRLAGWDGKRP